MKVYSWETLIVTILVCGVAIIFQVKNIIEGDSLSYLYLIFWIYLTLKGLWVSLTREGYEEDWFRGLCIVRPLETFWFMGSHHYIGRVHHNYFRGVIAKFIPSSKYLPIGLLFVGLIYNIVIATLLRKQIKIEKKDYF